MIRHHSHNLGRDHSNRHDNTLSCHFPRRQHNLHVALSGRNKFFTKFAGGCSHRKALDCSHDSDKGWQGFVTLLPIVTGLRCICLAQTGRDTSLAEKCQRDGPLDRSRLQGRPLRVSIQPVWLGDRRQSVTKTCGYCTFVFGTSEYSSCLFPR